MSSTVEVNSNIALFKRSAVNRGGHEEPLSDVIAKEVHFVAPRPFEGSSRRRWRAWSAEWLSGDEASFMALVIHFLGAGKREGDLAHKVT